MNRHQNEKGIAIIIVIAIMVALMMLTTALLGTVTRMGDTAKSYKYDSLLRLGCLSGRAVAMANLDTQKKQIGDALFYIYCTDQFQYYDKDFKYKGKTETDDSFYVLRPRYYALDLGSCLSLRALDNADGQEKKVYTEMKGNVEAVGAQNENVDILGTSKNIGEVVSDYKIDTVLADNVRYFTFNDIGQEINKNDIFNSSMLFSPYGATTSPLEYDVKAAPQWLIASMIGNYRNDPYKVGGDGAEVSLEAAILKDVFDKIIEQRKTKTCAEISDGLLGTEASSKISAYDKNASFDDPVSEQQKKNAAIEKLVHSLFGSGSTKFVVKEGNVYGGGNFTGKLVDDSAGLSRYYRVIVKAELENLASGDLIGERYYEFVYDKKNTNIVSSRWFEME